METKTSSVLGPPIGYVDMLDIAMQKKSDAEAAAPLNKHPLRPSSAGKCARELAFEYAMYKGYVQGIKREAFTPETQRIFSLGHAVEKDIMYHFRGVPELQSRYAQQTLSFFRLDDGTLIEGNIDNVFLNPKWKCVVDFKSKKDKFSAYYASKWDEDSDKLSRLSSVEQLTETTFWVEDLEKFLAELDDPFFEANFLQLNLYACTEFMRERGIDHAAIIQINKNDSRMREVRFRPNEAVRAHVEEKFRRLASVVDETKDPTQVRKGFVLGSVKCAFCPFKDTCWEEDNATKEFYKTLPPKKGGWAKDVDRLGRDADVLEQLFSQWTALKANEVDAKRIEQDILKILDFHKTRKIKLDNGDVFEAKYLKDRVELRRSK